MVLERFFFIIDERGVRSEDHVDHVDLYVFEVVVAAAPGRDSNAFRAKKFSVCVLWKNFRLFM